MPGRRLHFIDWLRVLAVLLLFPFHAGRVFNAGEPFYVKGSEESTLLGDVLGFIGVWHMPILFVLAGASTYFALGRRSRREYANERVRRLLVPFIFGIFVFIPPQTWYGARFNKGYQGSYVEYLTSGDFLQFEYGSDDYFGGFGTGHLWFILFLFLMALAALPLWGGRHLETSRLVRLSRLLARPIGWPVAGFFLLVGEALPDIGGKKFFFYFVFFVLGYVAVCGPEFVAAAERHRWTALSLGVAGAVWWTATASWRDGLADPSVPLFFVVLAGMTAGWLVIVGALGMGRRYLDRSSRTLAYLAEGSYPIYILHQTVIVILAFYVVRMKTGWVLEWLVLLAGSVVLTFLAYEGVRRLRWLRPLFGMRPLPSAAPEVRQHRRRPAVPRPTH